MWELGTTYKKDSSTDCWERQQHALEEAYKMPFKSARIEAESGVTRSSNTEISRGKREQDTICMRTPKLLYLDNQMPQIRLVIITTLAFCETSRCRKALQ
jgi:hypothetical protein